MGGTVFWVQWEIRPAVFTTGILPVCDVYKRLNAIIKLSDRVATSIEKHVIECLYLLVKIKTLQP